MGENMHVRNQEGTDRGLDQSDEATIKGDVSEITTVATNLGCSLSCRRGQKAKESNSPSLRYCPTGRYSVYSTVPQRESE